jgi:hypothetical protein
MTDKVTAIETYTKPPPVIGTAFKAEAAASAPPEDSVPTVVVSRNIRLFAEKYVSANHITDADICTRDIPEGLYSIGDFKNNYYWALNQFKEDCEKAVAKGLGKTVAKTAKPSVTKHSVVTKKPGHSIKKHHIKRKASKSKKSPKMRRQA